MQVAIISKEGEPLMPTKRLGKVRKWLKEGKAIIVAYKPIFTIQLQFETTAYKQDLTLGIDSGYVHIGYSVTSNKEEIIGGEVTLRNDVSEKLKERAMYRKQRRGRLRYREPRFNNRTRKEGWLAPSIQLKLDTHILFIEKLQRVLPITKTIVEVANFDIQQINNPAIQGVQYQQGAQSGFWNLREYILHRDNHECQNPNCTNKDKNPILQVHYIGFWYGNRSDSPNNLVTLCDKCHTPANHQPTGFLYGWKPKVKSFKDATFMSMVRWRLVNHLKCEHTYGFDTKSKRIAYGIEKSHQNDAFVVSGGSTQLRETPTNFEQVRRNNRSLERFYDAKYIDLRTGKTETGQTLFSGRRTRNKTKNSENLRQYRGEKVRKGTRSIRKQRYPLQPKDVVLFEGKRYLVVGCNNKGKSVVLKDCAKTPSTKKVKLLQYAKGLRFCN